MNHVISAALIALFASPACAQAPLDLRLPPAAVVSSADAAAATDPPGKYYGDVDGSADASKTKVWGSVTMGLGYSEGFGTAESVGAELNVSRQLDDGRRMDLHINVERSSGFGWRSPYNYYGPHYQGY